MKRALPSIASLSLLAVFAGPLTAAEPAPGRLAILRVTHPMDEGDDEYRFLVGLIEKEHFDLAVEEARKFLREHPRHGKVELARYRLATALFELDRLEEAAPHYARLGAKSGFEYRAESLFRSGQCELTAGRLPQARKAFEDVLATEQDYLHEASTFFLGEALFQAGDHAEAEKRYDELVRRYPSSEFVRDSQRGLAWCAWETGRADVTIERTQLFLHRHGSHAQSGAAEMRVLLGEAFLEAGHPREAAAAYRHVQPGEYHDAALRGVGFALSAQGKPAEAARSFGELVQRYPDSPHANEARLQGGIHQLEAGDTAGALATLRKAEGTEALLWLAEAERKSGAGEAALATLKRVERQLRSTPDPALESRMQIARGELLTELGRGEEAVRAFESAGSEYALYAAAVAKLNDGQPEDAIRLGTRLLRDHKDGDYASQTRLVLGEALFQIERYSDAERALGPLASSEDQELGARALSRLGWCRYLLGDPAGASEPFRDLVQRFPKSEEASEALFMLGRSHQDAGQGSDAARAFARYVKENPEGKHAAEALFGLAETGPDNQAERYLRQVAERHGTSDLAPRALLSLGDRQSETGRGDEAAESYRAVLAREKKGPLAVQARYGLAWCLFEAEEFRAAAEELERIDTTGLERPFIGSIAELGVWCWSRAGDAERATRSWRTMAKNIDQDERRFQAARAVIETCKQAERRDTARNVLDELLGSLRDKAVATAVLLEGAYLSLEEDDVARAKKEIELAKRNAGADPRVREASFYLGEAFFAAGQDDDAAEAYRDALDHEGVGPRALYKLGFANLRRNENARAEAAFGRLVREHPNSELIGESLFLLGEACFRQDAFDRAVVPLEKMRAEHKRHEARPKALFRLGVSLAHLERFAEAEAVLAELAKRHPKFENLIEAELWRGRALVFQGKERAATQALERVIAADRGELAADARLALGTLHEQKGRPEEALSEYLKVAVLYAHGEKVAEALFRAGRVLEAQGDVEKAMRQYRELTRDHRDSPFAKQAAERMRELTQR